MVTNIMNKLILTLLLVSASVADCADLPWSNGDSLWMTNRVCITNALSSSWIIITNGPSDVQLLFEASKRWGRGPYTNIVVYPSYKGTVQVGTNFLTARQLRIVGELLSSEDMPDHELTTNSVVLYKQYEPVLKEILRTNSYGPRP